LGEAVIDKRVFLAFLTLIVLLAALPAGAQMPPRAFDPRANPAASPAATGNAPGAPAGVPSSLASANGATAAPAVAASQPPPPPGQSLQQGSVTPLPATSSWWSVTNAMTISAVVLIFGAASMGVTAFLIRRERDSQVILRALATMLIITLAVFLIVAGYSDQQIAPAMGLLGTIAGYLLGKEPSRMPAEPDGKKTD
jgi:hypothetical protein